MGQEMQELRRDVGTLRQAAAAAAASHAENVKLSMRVKVRAIEALRGRLLGATCGVVGLTACCS